MKKRNFRRFLGILLSVLLFFGGIPTDALHQHEGEHAHGSDLLQGFVLEVEADWEEAQECEHCGGKIYGDWICDGGTHCGENSDRSDCYESWHCGGCNDCIDNETDLCAGCNKCSDCVTICYDCGEKCTECADWICDNCERCPGCVGDETYCKYCDICFDCAGEMICICEEGCVECSYVCEECREKCSTCAPEEICVDCGVVCKDCAGDGNWCDSCGRCRDCAGYICECGNGCGECTLICECEKNCENCTGLLCASCGMCKDCVGDGGWCDNCNNCGECVDTCICGGGCSECATVCPDCNEKCTNCADAEICGGCNVCKDCVGGEGNFCDNCETCINCAEYVCYCGGGCSECAAVCEGCMEQCENCGTLCEECGYCTDCVGSEGWCDNCNFCGQCVVTCECGTGCESCALLCPECGEKCDRCAQDEMCGSCSVCWDCAGDYCGNCGMCGDCAYICSCGYGCNECSVVCECFEACENCCDEMCVDCEICIDCAGADAFCYNCMKCENCTTDICSCGQSCGDCGDVCEGCTEHCLECYEYFCDDCGLCRECTGEDQWCEQCNRCVECTEICSDCGSICKDCAEDWCEECGTCSGCMDWYCPDCGICRDCADAMCEGCGYCGDCASVICSSCESFCDSCAVICEGCENCENCTEQCEECDYCVECCEDNSADKGCVHGICMESQEWERHYCTIGNHCIDPSVAGQYGYDEYSHWYLCDENCSGKLNEQGHLFGKGVITKIATTRAQGIVELTCTECGYVTEEKIAKVTGSHLHDFEDIVVPADCMSGGYTIHECSCGAFWMDSMSREKEHSYIMEYNAKEHWGECKWCHQTLDEAQHVFGAWKVIREPKYINMGERIHSCIVCDYTCVESMPTLPHNGRYVVVLEDGKGHVIDELLSVIGEKTVPQLPKLDSADGKYFKEWKDKTTGKAVNQGEKMTGNITLIPVWAESKGDVTKEFSDIVKGQWYIEAVQYVYDNGLMSGSKGLFKPSANITREQVVATLHNMEGNPKVSNTAALNAMKDVKAGQWYTDAIGWAYSAGVATGNSSTKLFGVGNPITRQQLAMMLFNYAKIKGYDTTTRGDYSKLKGANEVASYAVNAMKWAYGTGLISGSKTNVGGTTVYNLNPTGNATRAQMASILKQFCEAYGI